ncbi:MAG: hypothetical protein HYR97_06265 [Candidatus Melainabacteria bacterium]|nr:hypothetical protein [Candidatus Melainabacteria bacterium]
MHKALKNSLALLVIILSLFSYGISIPKDEIKSNTPKAETEDSDINTSGEAKETYLVAKVLKVIADIEEDLPGGNKQRVQHRGEKIPCN